MIIQNVVREVFSTGVENTTRMSIDASIESHIIKLVTENSYREPLASGIREAVSNSLDSMTEAGNTDPVIVSLQKNESGKWEFSSQDTGLGLDDVGFNKYIMGIGQSSKQQSSVLLGGYGLGSKAFLSYTNSYVYICIKDGLERKYLVFKGAEFPESLLIHEKETTEPNGVTVKVELLNQYNEFTNALEAIKKQLAYLPNVYFNVQGIDNTYNIYRNELFQWNTLQPINELHISLKNIYYPIDWNAIGISKIMLPVAIRFDEYDCLAPVFNREELKWDEAAKTAVKTKIKEIADWFITRYNESVKEVEITDIPNKWESFNPGGKKLISIEGKEFDIGGILPHTTVSLVKPKIKGIEVLNTNRLHGWKYILLKNWQLAATGRYKTVSVSKNYAYDSVFNWAVYGTRFTGYAKTKCRIFSCEKVPSGIYREYLQDTILKDIDNYVFLRRQEWHPTLVWFKQNLFFKQDGITKDKWRAAIKEFLAIKAALETMMEPLEAYQITDAWRDARKVNRASSGPVNRTYVKKEEVNLREVVAGVNKDYILAAGQIVEVDNLDKQSIVIYGLPDEKDTIGRLKTLGLKVYCMAQRDIDRINLPNWLTARQYLKGDTDHFKKKCLWYKKLNYWEKIKDNHSFKFLCTVDPWMANVNEWFKTDGNISNLRHYNIWSTILGVAYRKEWWNDTEADLKFAIVQEVIKTKDLSFLHHIHQVHLPPGLEIAKELYYSRIEKQKQKKYETTPHQGGKDYR